MISSFFRTLSVLTISLVTFGCGTQVKETSINITDATHTDAPIVLNSFWIRDEAGRSLLDPQTSGLVEWRDSSLLSIPDGSADVSQVLQVLQIDPVNNRIVAKMPITSSETVQQGCFGEYLSDRPDLEALAIDPEDDSIFYTVTEDARRYSLSPECAAKFKETGSTEYPTLLVRMQLNQAGDAIQITDVRPLQYSPDMKIGNHANDGIEGMTFGEGRELFLALEKDDNFAARIFSVSLDEGFWASSEFVQVKDEKLDIPTFDDGRPHPINGMTFTKYQGAPWLIAAARNDNEIWLIDANKKQNTKVIKVDFLAEVFSDNANECPEFEVMDNFSMEGVAVMDDELWIVNDPWKQNYMKNVQCPANTQNYQRNAPLLTKIKLERLF